MFSGCEPTEEKSGEKAITAFGFALPPAVGVIDEAAKTIVVDVPAGTDVKALAPVIVMSSPVAKVSPGNGVPNDFTNPVSYTVTAEDGSTASYTVTVRKPASSGDKAITAFGFSTPSAVGVINESAKTIAVEVPAGTAVTALSPVITVSAGATVIPASGAAQNFTAPVKYTVTAADGTKAEYTVTVTVEGAAASPQELQGDIGESRTIADLGLEVDYIVPNWIEFNNNAVITVDAGVCIAFRTTDGVINVSAGATVKMNGTAAKPIQLRGAGNAWGTEKGSWGYIGINTNSDNVLQYVECINGGHADDAGVGRIGSGAQVTMTNCTVNGSLGMGV
ncbi:MAG: DUF5018 domain-containing protein, partial [Cytophagaceae bacterium]|nr:DUF5018 domain-containing protein [Cytophagaceae bacterium]